MFLLLSALALASEGSYCVATWRPATPGCSIDEAIVTSATGPTRDVAERVARRRIQRVAELTADDLVLAGEITHPAQFWSCGGDAAELADVTCSAQPSRNEGDLCFVTFDDPECWDGTVLTVDDTWSRAVVAGRKQMCDAVDARQVRLNYTNLDQRREVCRQRCATSAVVSCPPVR